LGQNKAGWLAGGLAGWLADCALYAAVDARRGRKWLAGQLALASEASGGAAGCGGWARPRDWRRARDKLAEPNPELGQAGVWASGGRGCVYLGELCLLCAITGRAHWIS